jgi:hypothetical protein
VRGKYHKKTLDDVRLFPFSYNHALHLWNQALEESGYDKKDEVTKRNIYHIHGLRKFFRSQCTVAGIEPNIAEMFLGHIAGLSQYHQYQPEFIAQQYRKFEDTARIMVDPVESPETLTKIEQMERTIQAQQAQMNQMNRIIDSEMHHGYYNQLQKQRERELIADAQADAELQQMYERGEL